MQILNSDIDSYITGLLPDRDAVLLEMEDLGRKRNFPIVGPLVGRLCYQMVKLTNARRIFEMGSGFGYSAYWMAQALPDDAQIVLTESSQENTNLAKDFFRRGGLWEKADIRQGNALEIILKMKGPFDLIMNDVDKERYPDALELIIPRLRQGGLLITDNMFWDGKVVRPGPDTDTRGVLEYTKRVFNSKDLWTTVLPLRDGVGLSLKL